MEEIKITSYIKNIAFSIDNVYNLNGKIDINKKEIYYKEENIDVTVNYEDFFVIREHDEYLIEMKFVTNEDIEGRYLLKDTNTYLYMKVYTKEIEKKENSIRIRYDLMMANDVLKDFEYYLEWS